ncbi:organomercurial lyase [Egibacter rhizosphaerae]|nr:organomercurial lyase [Egibacter rhizosphaerae]
MGSALDPDATNRLFDAVCGTATPSTEERAAIRAVYASLRDGEPVTVPRLATTVEWDEARAHELLARLPNVERDATGAVIGFGGLTLRPTGHEITIEGATRYAWCAWDTLFLPAAIDREVTVASRCPVTAEPVTLRIAPTGILDRDPPEVVLSFLSPERIDPDDLRASFCGAVHFLVDSSAAEAWCAERDDRLVLELDDAHELGRELIQRRCGRGAR